MRSDPKGFSEVSAPLTAEAQALGARELRRIGLILAPHLASRRSGSARLLRSTRGPILEILHEILLDLFEIFENAAWKKHLEHLECSW